LRARVVEVAAVSALAAIVTVLIAAPVLRAPSERVFGMEIVGRHHDPFTVMEQFGRPISIGVYLQPVTDITGALLARVSGAVAAYNWLVLLTFPLSAAAAYLLARHLKLSPPGATVAAMAFAFSPFHVAHSAYHPHIAQTQWLPLYLLALWRCLDNASPRALVFLGAATMAVTLSNFYGGLIAAVITPVAIAAYWLVMRRADPRSLRRLGITIGALVLLAAGGLAYAWYAASAVVGNRAAFAFPRAALFGHSATWWSYFIPPVAHPLLGRTARRVWAEAGVYEELVEQQVSLGWGIVALGLIAIVLWLVRRRQVPLASLAGVPVLVIVAVAALVCSLSPEGTIGSFMFARPSAFLYDVVPMFRAYARFGVIVQLMAALLAGISVDYLRRVGTRRAQVAWLALVALAISEYAVAPSAMWRDVLPTSAHRWVAQQGDHIRVLDCTPLNQESASVQWLTDDRVRLPGGAIDDCTDANLPQALAANGFTHLLVRRDTIDLQSFAPDHPMLDGLRLAARFDDGQVFEVSAQPLPIHTARMVGFSPRVYNAEWAWRSIGSDAAWTVVNTGARPIVAALTLEMSALGRARRLELRLDGRPVHALDVEPSRRIYRIGPLTVPPGDHELTFHPVDAATPAYDASEQENRRPLFAFGTWNWTVQDEPR
jgi:hypothetical protein